MVVSFCLEITYLKEPLQCATCSFRLLMASPKTITASLGTEVTIPHVELRLRRRISMCPWHFVLPRSPYVCGQCAGGMKARRGPGQTRVCTGESKCALSMESGVPLLTCLVILSKDLSFMVSVSFFVKESLRSI